MFASLDPGCCLCVLFRPQYLISALKLLHWSEQERWPEFILRERYSEKFCTIHGRSFCSIKLQALQFYEKDPVNGIFLWIL